MSKNLKIAKRINKNPIVLQKYLPQKEYYDSDINSKNIKF